MFDPANTVDEKRCATESIYRKNSCKQASTLRKTPEKWLFTPTNSVCFSPIVGVLSRSRFCFIIIFTLFILYYTSSSEVDRIWQIQTISILLCFYDFSIFDLLLDELQCMCVMFTTHNAAECSKVPRKFRVCHRILLLFLFGGWYIDKTLRSNVAMGNRLDMNI